MTRAKNRGFTLVELLVVATILSLLAAAGVTSYTALNRQSRDVRRRADLESIRSALEQYRSDNNTYPAALPTLLAPTQYINQIPDDPSTTKDYYYVTVGTPVSSYNLCAALGIDPNSNETGCGTNTCGTGVPCNYRVNPLGVQ